MSFHQNIGGFMPSFGWLFRLMSNQRGRNSVVECQLPKLDVVGSSPIARSIFYPITFFLKISFVLIWVSPGLLFAQLSTDATLPFGQGGVIDLPATSAYLGDLPHSISLVTNDFQSSTIGGIQVPLVGWTDPLGQPSLGIHSAAPGVVFEDIPYPLASASSLNVLPFSGTAEIFNFPAAAWWGNNASNGAIELVAPTVQDKPIDSFSVAGGTQGIFSDDDQFKNAFLGVDFNYRHGESQGLGQTDNFNFISRENWLKTDALSLGSGFLGTRGSNGDDWYSTYVTFDLMSPNFQTLQLKPYFQTAQAGTQSIQEAGGILNYVFNLAELTESHLGIGFNSDSGSNAGLTSNNAFLQSTNLVDVLGDLTIDFAFRWDFSSIANTTFSTVVGIQGTMGSFVLLGDYDKDVMPITFQDVQQSDLGFRFQLNDSWNASLKYVYEQLGTAVYNGARGQLQTNNYDVLRLIRNLQFDFEEQALVDQNSSIFYDSGLTVKLRFTSVDQWWVTARCLSDEPVFIESGLSLMLDKELKVYGSVENIAGIGISVPDSDQPVGTVISGGLQYTFN
jgi:hypothetical protein